MATPFSQYVYSVYRQAAGECRQVLHRLLATVAGTPLPRWLVVAMAVLLALSLIPFLLALCAMLIMLRVLFSLLRPRPGADSAQADSGRQQRRMPR